MSLDLLSLFTLFCVVVLPYALWRFGRLQTAMPCAVVQILLGILLGPSGLGAVAPVFRDYLLPAMIQERIAGLSAFAVFFFALLTGLHLDPSQFRGRQGGVALVGLCSVFVPFCFGAAAAWWVLETYPSLARGEGPWGFILPMAIALSVTALPVLGAILREMGLVHQPIGQWSLGLAAINDAVLWLMVSGILAGTGAGHVGILDMPPLLTLGAGLLYLAGMWGGVRPLLARVFQGERAGHHAESGVLVAVTAFAVLSAVATEVLGLHYLLGAFVAGAVLPGPVRALVLERIEHVTVLLLTPFFFLSIGLRVTLDFSSRAFVGVFILATVAAIAGKFAGTALPARGQGLSWRESLALGALMQSKGMMELAVLSIFVGAGLMSDTVFSALTAMTLVTTTLAMPLTRLILSVAGAGRPCLDTLPEDA